MKKNISVLGSTGSIGTQTLEVARELGIKICGLTANKNISLLESQIREFRPEVAAVFNEAQAKKLKENVKDTNTKILTGTEGLCKAATLESADIILTAVSGMIGLEPTIAAINEKKDIALANKETLVVGGKLIMDLAKKQGVKILPVDSEHSAIFQCLEGCCDSKHLKKLILTASGGPFLGKTKQELEKVTVADALSHPSWNMGAKITIDCATMMNKGLEIIEAVHLFGMPAGKIDVVVHPQSIVHSMVEYIDGSVIAQMGTPSMKTPIQYAITYPERTPCNVPPLNLAELKNLSFFEPDNETFETMSICREAINSPGAACVVINAANEEAVNQFLNGKIKFLDIVSLIKKANKHFSFEKAETLKDILEVDKKVKRFVTENI